MTIPLSTTTITILRPTVVDGDKDGYPDEEPTWGTVSSGTRAVVSSGRKTSVSGGGTTIREGSEQFIGTFRMAADPCDLRHTDRVLDEKTQTVYRVDWVAQALGLGLDHVSAGLEFVEGFNP